MATEIKAPVFPESVADGTIATWHKKVGEPVSRDEVICDIETDKVVLEVVAPADGSLVAIIKGEGDTVLSDEVIAQFEAGAVAALLLKLLHQQQRLLLHLLRLHQLKQLIKTKRLQFVKHYLKLVSMLLTFKVQVVVVASLKKMLQIKLNLLHQFNH
jgi:pyruvate/2-oxoglutarate dehydrogenase complex dihydrolipoamide acyltransferase (E2) component